MKKFLFLGLLPFSLILSVACPQNSGSAKVTSTEWAKAINALINRDIDHLADKSKSLAKDGSENSKLPLSGKTSGYTLDISCKMKSGDSFETFKGKQWIAKTWFVQESDDEILADYTKEDNSVWFADKQGNNWLVYSNNTQLKERYSTYEEFVKSLRVLEAQYDNAKLTSKGYKIEGYANNDVNDGIYKEKKNKEGEAWGTFYLKFNSEKQISSFSIVTEDGSSGDFGVKYSDDLKYDFGEVIPNFQ